MNPDPLKPARWRLHERLEIHPRQMVDFRYPAGHMDEILFLGILFIVLPPLFTSLLVFNIRKGNRREEKLLRDGIKLEAILISMTETGRTVNNAPEIEMEFSLELPDGSTIDVKHRCFVGLLDLANLSIGDRLPVAMDSEDSDRIVVLTMIS